MLLDCLLLFCQWGYLKVSQIFQETKRGRTGEKSFSNSVCLFSYLCVLLQKKKYNQSTHGYQNARRCKTQSIRAKRKRFLTERFCFSWRSFTFGCSIAACWHLSIYQIKSCKLLQALFTQSIFSLSPWVTWVWLTAGSKSLTEIWAANKTADCSWHLFNIQTLLMKTSFFHFSVQLFLCFMPFWIFLGNTFGHNWPHTFIVKMYT